MLVAWDSSQVGRDSGNYCDFAYFQILRSCLSAGCPTLAGCIDRCGLTLRLRGRICWRPWFMMYARFPVARASRALSSSLAGWRIDVQAGRVWMRLFVTSMVVVARVLDMSERGRTSSSSSILDRLALEIWGNGLRDWRSSGHFHFTSLTRALTGKKRVNFWNLSTNDSVA
jgi:hypothetical protein